MFMYLNEVDDNQTKKDLALIIEEVLKQRIEGVKNIQGKPITIAFPKLIFVLDENNIHEDSEFYYLTKLAAECSSKRLVPDYISAKIMKKLKEGSVFPVMGCRSALSPYYDSEGKPKYYGRFNQGVVTINLPDVALSSEGDFNKFWKILDERLELCYRALMVRHNSLIGVKSDIAPILWQHGAYARLKEGEVIDDLLYNGYSTISLGYAGLYECVKYMTNQSHTQPKGKNFGLQVMKALNSACERWKQQTNIGFSVYGSPIESTTYKFAKCLQQRFGVVDGITDKKYITNSYHITPSEEIDAFNKLTLESEFQELSSGGAISYVETPNMTKNVDAILEVLRHIYETIMYAEINTTTSHCHICGCTDIKMEDDLKFHCPQCGNDDFNKMNIAVRVCGYISTNPFNEGRAEDIYDRVYHLGMD
nr:MAG TPA: anaerobic ribonucleoside triphosphate reductase [Caudoviricetes sp.]